MSRAAIYLRVSTDEQISSLDAQELGARAWCDRNGHSVVAVYRDDGVSGSEWARRAGVQQLRADVEADRRPWDLVVVRDLDRLGRDAIRLPELLSHLRDYDVSVVEWSTGQTVALDGMALIVAQLRAGLAQIEREQIAHRVRTAHHQRAERGLVTGGSVYGYTNVRSADGVRYAIHESEAATVREMYELHAAGESARRIAARLNRAGIPSPRSDGGGTGSWCSATVLMILRSERYKGTATWGRVGSRYRGGSRVTVLRDDVIRYEVPAIVSADLWQRAQARSADARAARGSPQRLSHEPRYLLVGHAVCDHCGGPLAGWRSTSGSGSKRRPHLVYRCRWHADRGPEVCSASYARPQAPIDRAILTQLADALTPDEVRGYVARARTLLRPEAVDTRRIELEAAERDASARVSRLTSAVELGAGDVAGIVERLRAASGELAAIRTSLAALAVPPVMSLDVERQLVTAASDVRGSILYAQDRAAEGDLDAMRHLRGVLGTSLTAPLRARLEGGSLNVKGQATPGALLGWSESTGGNMASGGDPNGFLSDPMWNIALFGAA